MDGVPMVGEISAIEPQAKFSNGKIDLFWIPINSDGKAKIYLSTTNNFKNGGKDNYQLMKELDVKDWHTTVDVTNLPSKFYKVVIEMPYNTLNRWIWNTEK